MNQEESDLEKKENSAFLPSKWEIRFEDEINQLFDDAIERLPRFVDRHFRSLRKVMRRNLSPKTSLGDLYVGLRNLASGMSEVVGGPSFETTTFTEDEIAEAFEREVLSPYDLEALLSELFEEFEQELWKRFEEKNTGEVPNIEQLQQHLKKMIEDEIAHDPKLAQAVRSGIHIGIPATLGYFLFQRSSGPAISSKTIGSIGSQDMSVIHRLMKTIRGKENPAGEESSVSELTGNILGVTGAVLGSLVVGGILEYAFNSMRDLKGGYIRQINTARYVLLYGANPSVPNGRGILHIVRAIERRFDALPGYAANAFNTWLESGLHKDPTESNPFQEVEFFPSDAHKDVSVEEMLELADEKDLARKKTPRYLKLAREEE